MDGYAFRYLPLAHRMHDGAARPKKCTYPDRMHASTSVACGRSRSREASGTPTNWTTCAACAKL